MRYGVRERVGGRLPVVGWGLRLIGCAGGCVLVGQQQGGFGGGGGGGFGGQQQGGFGGQQQGGYDSSSTAFGGGFQSPGANGGGGGFGGSQDAGGDGGQKRPGRNASLTPVTVKQLQEATQQDPENSTFMCDGVELAQVRLRLLLCLDSFCAVR